VGPLKLTEPHHMFHGTLGFRGTSVEEHCSIYNSKSFSKYYTFLFIVSDICMYFVTANR